MTDGDRVFKALGDPTRRFLLDLLFERDGRTLTELESELAMTRFGVMKHLRVLADADLVVTRRSGREKLHFLNPVPIRQIHDRWIDKYTARQVSALLDLKSELEGTMTAMTEAKIVHVSRVHIKATPQAIWDAITQPEWIEKYGYRCPTEYDLRPGGRYRALASKEMKEYDANTPDVLIEGEVIEVDPPRKLVQTWHALWEPVEGVTRLTWEIKESRGGVSSLTVTHELDSAPHAAAMVNGEIEEAGGGWSMVLSELKTLLETGKPMFG